MLFHRRKGNRECGISDMFPYDEQCPWSDRPLAHASGELVIVHEADGVQVVQVVAYDFGTKHNILRRLASHGCKITVVPADYPADKVIGLNPDGVFLSNGPVRVRLST